MISSGENLSECRARGIDLTQPVSAELIHHLPTATVKRDGRTTTQFAKQAFVFDKASDCYYCPHGKMLPFSGTSMETRVGGMKVERRRFKASEDDCQTCPLLALCVVGKTKHRTLSREPHEELREAHAKKMASPEAQEIYGGACDLPLHECVINAATTARRRWPAEFDNSRTV